MEKQLLIAFFRISFTLSLDLFSSFFFFYEVIALLKLLMIL